MSSVGEPTLYTRVEERLTLFEISLQQFSEGVFNVFLLTELEGYLS